MDVLLTYGHDGNINELPLNFTRISVDMVKALENEPALYLLHNKEGEIIYVGQSVYLKKRIREHLGGTNASAKYSKLIHGISYSYIAELSFYERMIGEALLINKFSPEYNGTYEKSAKRTGNSSRKIPDEILYDILYYAREKRYPYDMVAKALDVPKRTVARYGNGGVGGYIQLPKNYKPRVILETNERMPNRRKINFEMFCRIRDTYESSVKDGRPKLSYKEIATLYGFSPNTVSRVCNLGTDIFKFWEKERKATV